MTEYVGTISDSATFTGTSVLGSYTASITQTNNATAILDINPTSFVGTIDQVFTTSGTASLGPLSTPFTTTEDTGALALSGTISQPTTITFSETGTILSFPYTASITETLQLSSDLLSISISGTETASVNGITQTITFSGQLKTDLLSTLSLDQQTELIYIGYYNRAADAGGFSFWEGQDAHAQAAATTGGFGQSAAVALTNIANSFTPQAETIAIYPFLSNTAPNYSDPTVQAGLATFIENVYGNLFGHTADSGGLAYWTGQLESGAVGLGAAVLAIANGAQGSDAIILQNKITVALDFTNLTGAANVPATSALLAEAKTILAGVDGISLNDASVTAAEALIAPWIATDEATASSVAVVGHAMSAVHSGLL